MRRAVCAALLLLLVAGAAGAAGLDTVAAVVNGTPITATDVAREAAFATATGLTPLDPQLAGGETDLLSQMITALLLRQRAAAIGIVVEDAEIDATIGRIAANNRITAADLEAKLKDANGTWERFRGRMGDRLLQPRLLDREVVSGVIVTGAEVEEAYGAQRERFRRPTRIHLGHLLVPLPADAGADAVAAAEGRLAAARGRLEAGATIDALAAELAGDGVTGGDLGWFGRGELQAALEEAAFPLPVGGVAGPVRTAAGVHLVRVGERQEEEVAPLAEARPAIEEEIHRAKAGEAVRGYLEKLRREAIIRFPK